MGGVLIWLHVMEFNFRLGAIHLTYNLGSSLTIRACVGTKIPVDLVTSLNRYFLYACVRHRGLLNFFLITPAFFFLTFLALSFYLSLVVDPL